MKENYERLAVFLTLAFFWMFLSLTVLAVSYFALFFYFEAHPADGSEGLISMIAGIIFFIVTVTFGLIIFWRKKESEDLPEEEN